MDKTKSADDNSTIESIEEHYAKIYSDLPQDVVKMLISTHPLYGKDKTVKEDKIPEDMHKIENQDTAEVDESEKAAQEDEDLEDEKEYINALFARQSNKNNLMGWVKYLLVGTFLGFVLIFGVYTVYKNINNNEVMATMIEDNKIMVKQLSDLEIQKQQLVEKNNALTSELEQIKQSMEALQQQTKVEDNKAQTTSGDNTKASAPVTTPKTYAVKSGDSLWKISEKTYGTGKYYLDIMKANAIKNEGDIYVGMTLKLPDIKGGN